VDSGHDFTADHGDGSGASEDESSSDEDDFANELQSLELLKTAAKGTREDIHSFKHGLDPEVTDFSSYSRYSSVLGDAFHFIDRPKVPVHHSAKKPFKHAFGEALLPFDHESMEVVYAVLTAAGMTAEQIQRKRFWSPR
jgi:hypothetical protein